MKGQISLDNSDVDIMNEIDNQMNKLHTLEELDQFRDYVELEVSDAKVKKYIIELLDAKYRDLQCEKDKTIVENLKNDIIFCNSVDDAVELRKKIYHSSISNKEKYLLGRELKVRISEQYESSISKGRNLDVNSRKLYLESVIFGFILTGICYLAYKLLPIEWAAEFCKYGVYILLGITALMLFALLISTLKWIFSSKDQKECSKLLDCIKRNELYFNSDDYFIHDSDIRYLRMDEIKDDIEWKYKARQEIFARHGTKFNSEDDELKNVFSGKAWYDYCPNRIVTNADLNKYEVANYNLLCDNDPELSIKYL